MMGLKEKIKLLLLIIIAGCTGLAGCKKNEPAAAAASIVGTWSQNNQTLVFKAGSNVFLDSTIQVTGGLLYLTFTSDGYYTQTTTGGSLHGGYILYGNTLSIYDTAALMHGWQSFNIPLLNEHQLQIVIAADTVMGNPDTIKQLIGNFTR